MERDISWSARLGALALAHNYRLVNPGSTMTAVGQTVKNSV